MDLLAYWKWDNYHRDTGRGECYHFNSKKPRLQRAVDIGDSVWLISQRQPQKDYVLLERLVVMDKPTNTPTYEYGTYRVVGDPEKSIYYDPYGPDMTPLLMELQFASRGRYSSPESIPMSTLSMRSLTQSDSEMLENWAKGVPVIVPPKCRQ